jgi:hypothetical protein
MTVYQRHLLVTVLDIALHSIPETMKYGDTHLANLTQNCVKYFREEARLSRITGTVCFKCEVIAVT